MLNKLEEIRKQHGMTQEELAEILNISWRQLQRIEKNEEQTKITTLKKIIKVLKIQDKEIIDFIKK